MTRKTRRRILYVTTLAIPLATSFLAYASGETSLKAAIAVALLDFLTALGALAQSPPAIGPGQEPKA